MPVPKPVMGRSSPRSMPGESNRPIPGRPGRFQGSKPTMRRFPGGAGGSRARDFQGRFVKGGFGFSMVGIDACGEAVQLYGKNVGLVARRAAVDALATAALQKMKQEASWNDRTGDARAKLIALAIHDDGRMMSRLVLGHGVYYGYYLEFGLGGYYKIIEPTLHWAASRMPEAVATEAPKSGSRL